jgi:hypothetical protein
VSGTEQYAATSDFGAAAFAVALGFAIDLRTVGPGKYEFRCPADAQTAIDNYFRNDALVQARAYSAAMRDLRTLLNREGQRRGGGR